MAGLRKPRRPNGLMRSAAPVALAAALASLALLQPRPALAQAWAGVGPSTAGAQNSDGQMLVQANEIVYDYSSERVLAVGNVQIHYSGSVLEADRVIYNQSAKTLAAEGNVRLTDERGNILNTDRLELDESFRNGFIDSLHIETVDRTRIAAARADRSTQDGRSYTVFRSGVYTACEPCAENPQKPPQWQVKAARVLHDEDEKTIYFEDARLELFGVPVAYLPYFWAPDPSVKKKTGFLFPSFISGTYSGFGMQVPFFWNLAPDYDITFSPAYMTRQGLLLSTEWRHRLVDGAYSIRASGIFQQDKNAFPVGTPGHRDFRGAVETKGDFRLSQNWWYGWDASIFTDNAYSSHYRVSRFDQEVVSQAYLFGRGDYSYFDLRGLHFYGMSSLDVQKQLPVVHPVLDYKYRFAQPIFGGEVSYNVNLTSLSREQADFDPITNAAAASGICNMADPAVVKSPADCLLRGIAGTYTRLSVDAMWRRSITDPIGQVFTPFLWARADAATVSYNADPSMRNFIDTSATSMGRVTPAVGLDYRYPFISAHSWGTQIIEPRAQIIARPGEQGIGRFPNEDAQSLVFGDDNLFDISKFPGYDRVEGGGRANVGIQYTAQFNNGGYLNALFGQSYHLFGTNSYATPDMANAGLNSGLETNRSDYVARLTYQPNATYGFTSRFRFDEQTFATRRLELEGRMNFERWNASVTYGRYDAQPEIGMLRTREGILGAASVKLTQNWSISGGALYSIDSNRLNAITAGLSYIDECLSISAVYQKTYGYLGDVVPNEVVLLRINLRTLGETQYQHQVGGATSNDRPFSFF